MVVMTGSLFRVDLIQPNSNTGSNNNSGVLVFLAATSGTQRRTIDKLDHVFAQTHFTAHAVRDVRIFGHGHNQ